MESLHDAYLHVDAYLLFQRDIGYYTVSHTVGESLQKHAAKRVYLCTAWGIRGLSDLGGFWFSREDHGLRRNGTTVEMMFMAVSIHPFIVVKRFC